MLWWQHDTRALSRHRFGTGCELGGKRFAAIAEASTDACRVFATGQFKRCPVDLLRSNRAGRKFICGEPMKPATKRLAGRR